MDLILRPKFKEDDSSTTAFMEFYDYKADTIDVLFFGSSHIYINIDPAIIWKEQGIASHVLGSSIQTLSCSFHYFVEALKYQKPKMVVIDLLRSNQASQFTNASRYARFSAGLYPSLNKFKNIRDTIGDTSQRLALFLGIPHYHSRFKALGEADFISFTPNRYIPTRGTNHNWRYRNRKRRQPFEYPFQAAEVALSTVPEESRKYLDTMMDLARLNKIKLLFVLMPHNIRPQDRPAYKAVADYVTSKGFEFIDDETIYREAGLDSKTDYADASHMNRAGVEKTSLYFSKLLSKHMEFADKRTDVRYADWNEHSQWLEKLYAWSENMPFDAIVYSQLKQKTVRVSRRSDAAYKNGIHQKNPHLITVDFTWTNYFLLSQAAKVIIDGQAIAVKEAKNNRGREIIVTLEQPLSSGITNPHITVELKPQY